MTTLTPNDLPTLSKQDRGLLFNYFGSRAGASRFVRLAAGWAVIGFITALLLPVVGRAYPLEAGTPEWLHLAVAWHQVVLAVLAMVTACYWLWRARQSRLNVELLAAELARRDLDVSRLTEQHVFDRVVLPMLRHEGIPVAEDEER